MLDFRCGSDIAEGFSSDAIVWRKIRRERGGTCDITLPFVCAKFYGKSSRSLEACLVSLYHPAKQPGDARKDIDTLKIHQRNPETRYPQHLQRCEKLSDC